MELGEIFGLPAHPLLVHIPVMLIPLVAIGGVWIALSPSMRGRIGWIVVVLAGVAAVGSQLAAGSGEALEEALEGSGEEASATLDQHTEMGDTFVWFALLLFVAVLALMIWDRRTRQDRADDATATQARSPVAIGLVVLVLLASAVASVRVYQVGHSGAKAVWEQDGQSLDFSGEGEEGGESGETGEG